MAVAYRSHTNPAFSFPSTNVTGTEPAGATQNDILVAHLYIESNTAVTPPSGWSNTMNGTTMMVECTAGAVLFRHYSYWIRRGASAPDLTWLFASSGNGVGIAAYSGAITTGDPFSFGAVAKRDTTGAKTYPDNSGTTSVANELLIWAGFGLDADGAGTQPTGFTERQDVSGIGFELADKAQAAAGATGTITGASYAGGTNNPTTDHLAGLMPPTVLTIGTSLAKVTAAINIQEPYITNTPRLNAYFEHFWGGRS